jgi:hypothetical protein
VLPQFLNFCHSLEVSGELQIGGWIGRRARLIPPGVAERLNERR